MAPSWPLSTNTNSTAHTSASICMSARRLRASYTPYIPSATWSDRLSQDQQRISEEENGACSSAAASSWSARVSKPHVLTLEGSWVVASCWDLESPSHRQQDQHMFPKWRIPSIEAYVPESSTRSGTSAAFQAVSCLLERRISQARSRGVFRFGCRWCLRVQCLFARRFYLRRRDG
jgi:hypothetical protein